jgi:hypothetical protein
VLGSRGCRRCSGRRNEHAALRSLWENQYQEGWPQQRRAAAVLATCPIRPDIAMRHKHRRLPVGPLCTDQHAVNVAAAPGKSVVTFRADGAGSQHMSTSWASPHTSRAWPASSTGRLPHPPGEAIHPRTAKGGVDQELAWQSPANRESSWSTKAPQSACPDLRGKIIRSVGPLVLGRAVRSTGIPGVLTTTPLGVV